MNIIIWGFFICIYLCDTGTLQSSPPSTSPSTSQSSSPDDSDSDLAFSVNRSSSASESSLGRLPNDDIMPNVTMYVEALTWSQQAGFYGVERCGDSDVWSHFHIDVVHTRASMISRLIDKSPGRK